MHIGCRFNILGQRDSGKSMPSLQLCCEHQEIQELRRLQRITVQDVQGNERPEHNG